SGGEGAGGAPVGSGGSSCGTELDQEGCGCLVGDPPRSCYAGLAAQAGKGLCTLGKQTCQPSNTRETQTGTWGPCEGAGAPKPVTCDGTDADCDGAVDTGCPCTEGSTQPCSTPCGDGMQTCVGGAWTMCDAPQPNPDNSCPCMDGAVQPCVTSTGDP